MWFCRRSISGTHNFSAPCGNCGLSNVLIQSPGLGNSRVSVWTAMTPNEKQSIVSVYTGLS